MMYIWSGFCSFIEFEIEFEINFKEALIHSPKFQCSNNNPNIFGHSLN